MGVLKVLDQARIAEMAVKLLEIYGSGAIAHAAERTNQFARADDPGNAQAWRMIADTARAISAPRRPTDFLNA